MASSSRVFRQTLRVARNLKNSNTKCQNLVDSVHVTNSSKNLCQLSRPVVSICGLLNGQAKFNLKNKVQFVSPPITSTILARSAAFLPSTSDGSEDGALASSEGGSDSSCEAMEGPHGDDDGLVINSSSPEEDL